MEEIILKDFRGQELHIGDNVVIAEKTLSKTPYLIYGTITDISIEYFKNGGFNRFKITYTEKAQSDENYFCMRTYGNNRIKEPSEKRFYLSDASFVNIMKV